MGRVKKSLNAIIVMSKLITFSVITINLLDFGLAYGYEDGIRLAWDYRTLCKIDDGGYPRITKRQSGDLVFVVSWGSDTYIRISSDGGKTWGDRILADSCQSGVNSANAEITELANGWLLVAINERPSSEGVLPYRIITFISRDDGITWGDRRVVYTADTYFSNGCWEPVTRQIAGGEIHLFFANENPYRENGDQEITLFRSYDNGLTWTDIRTVSYRPGHRDGMPAPITLNGGNGYVFAIEDNGWDGTFKPSIIGSSVADNWNLPYADASSTRRWRALRSDYVLPSSVYAGAPYLVQLPGGETILSCQSSEGESNSDTPYMVVYIGDQNAANFSRKSVPFVLPVEESGLWNTLLVKDDQTLMALSSLSNGIWGPGSYSIDAHVIYPMKSPKGSIVFDGWANDDVYAQSQSIFIGRQSDSVAHVRTAWDDNNLYILFDITDRFLWNDSPEQEPWHDDSIKIYLDPQGDGGTLPQVGDYVIIGDIGGHHALSQGDGSWWVNWNPTGLDYRISYNGTLNNNDDIDTGYTMEVLIPWNQIGGKPKIETGWGINFSFWDDRDGGILEHENTIDGNELNVPKSWMRIDLVDHGAPVSYAENFDDNLAQKWSVYGGSWSVSEGVCSISTLSGDKALYQEYMYKDVAYSAHIKLTGGDQQEAGLLLRVTEPGIADTSLKGYYVGINAVNDFVIAGKFDGSHWTFLKSVSMNINTDEWYYLRIVASGPEMRVFINGLHVMDFYDGDYQCGYVGLRGWFGNAEIDNISTIGTVFLPRGNDVSIGGFSDNFDENNINGWDEYGGTWSVSEGQMHMAADWGGKVVANVIGTENCIYDADMYLSSGEAGLIFRVTEPGIGADNFFGYFAGLSPDANNVYLGKMNTSWTGIASTAMILDFDTWYHMKIDLQGDHIRIYVNGDLKIDAMDSEHTSGSIGIRTWNGLGKVDNVVVNSINTYNETFNNGNTNGWSSYGGLWSVDSGSLSVSAAWGDKIVADNIFCVDFVYEADMTITGGDQIGLIFRVTEPKIGSDAFRGYYAYLSAEHDYVSLGKMNNDWTFLVSSNMQLDFNDTYRIMVEAKGSRIRIFVNNVLMIDYTDTQFNQGTIGIRTYDGEGNVDNIRLTPLALNPPPEIIIQGNAITINSGDELPELADNTDFGFVKVNNTLDHTFVIHNLGIGDLTLITPIAISGDGFSVVTQPESLVVGGGSTNFVVRFAPDSVGKFAGIISIANNANPEKSYYFVMTASSYTSEGYIDINNDGKTGLEEIIYLLQLLAKTNINSQGLEVVIKTLQVVSKTK